MQRQVFSPPVSRDRVAGQDRYRVRRATLRDLGVLVRQRRDMWMDMGEADERELDDADRAYRRWARDRLRNGTLLGWLVEETATGRVVAGGCLWLRVVHPRPGFNGGKEPYLLSFSTDPDHRGRGLATLVANACLEWARKNHHPRVTLHASEAGRPIYEKLGFERAWEMRLDLDSRPHPSS